MHAHIINGLILLAIIAAVVALYCSAYSRGVTDGTDSGYDGGYNAGKSAGVAEASKLVHTTRADVTAIRPAVAAIDPAWPFIASAAGQSRAACPGCHRPNSGTGSAGSPSDCMAKAVRSGNSAR